MFTIEIHPLLKERRSRVLYSAQPVSDEPLYQLFEAARWAPSLGNKQPWRFIFAHRKDTVAFDNIFQCLDDGNREWVGVSVPVLVVTLAETISSRTGKENLYAMHDVGLATENLILQAVSMGLLAHPMAGFYREKTIRDLAIPEPFVPVAFIAVGYPGTEEEATQKMRDKENRKRVRKELEEIVFRNRWSGE